MIVGSKELIRDINTNLVLEAIIEKAPISRATLSKDLGLTKATISSIVQELITKDFVIEIGSGDTSVGRKPTMLTFHASSACTLCIDLGVNSIRYMTTDLLGNCLYHESIDLEVGYENHVIDFLTSIINHCLYYTKKSTYGLVGITIAIHGVTHNNKIIFTPYYNLHTTDIAGILKEQYHIPVNLYNEANLAVMGENIYSAKVENIASIYIYSGIGLGMVLNNQLYEGTNGYAGEFGHTIIELDGRQCPCGNKGCLEQYASQRALLKDLAIRKGRESISFEQFCYLYQSKDKDALYIIHQFVKIMAAGINNLLNLYNPEIILLNSRFTTEFPELLDEMKALLLPRMAITDSIRLSKMNDDAILYGAAYINIMHFLKLKNFHPQIQF